MKLNEATHQSVLSQFNIAQVGYGTFENLEDVPEELLYHKVAFLDDVGKCLLIKGKKGFIKLYVDTPDLKVYWFGSERWKQPEIQSAFSIAVMRGLPVISLGNVADSDDYPVGDDYTASVIEGQGGPFVDFSEFCDQI